MIFSGSAVFDAQNTSGPRAAGRPAAGRGLHRATGTRSRRRTSPRASTAAGPGRSSRATPCSTSARRIRSATRRSSGTSRRAAGSWRPCWPTSGRSDSGARRDLKSLGEAERLRPGRLGEGRLGMPRAVRGPGRRRRARRVALGPEGRRERRRPVRRLGRPVLRRPLRRQGVPGRGDEGAAPLWIDFGKDFYASQTWNDAPRRPAGLDRLDEQLAICQRHPDLSLARGHDDPADGGPPTDAGRPPPEPVAGGRRAGPPGTAPDRRGPSDPAGRDRPRRGRSRGPSPGSHRRVRAGRRRARSA